MKSNHLLIFMVGLAVLCKLYPFARALTGFHGDGSVSYLYDASPYQKRQRIFTQGSIFMLDNFWDGFIRFYIIFGCFMATMMILFFEDEVIQWGTTKFLLFYVFSPIFVFINALIVINKFIIRKMLPS